MAKIVNEEDFINIVDYDLTYFCNSKQDFIAALKEQLKHNFAATMSFVTSAEADSNDIVASTVFSKDRKHVSLQIDIARAADEAEHVTILINDIVNKSLNAIATYVYALLVAHLARRMPDYIEVLDDDKKTTAEEYAALNADGYVVRNH